MRTIWILKKYLHSEIQFLENHTYFARGSIAQAEKKIIKRNILELEESSVNIGISLTFVSDILWSVMVITIVIFTKSYFLWKTSLKCANMADNWVNMCLKILMKLELNKSSMSWIFQLTSGIRQSSKSGRWPCIVPLHTDYWDLGRSIPSKRVNILIEEKILDMCEDHGNPSTVYRQTSGDVLQLCQVIHKAAHCEFLWTWISAYTNFCPTFLDQ